MSAYSVTMCEKKQVCWSHGVSHSCTRTLPFVIVFYYIACRPKGAITAFHGVRESLVLSRIIKRFFVSAFIGQGTNAVFHCLDNTAVHTAPAVWLDSDVLNPAVCASRVAFER